MGLSINIVPAENGYVGAVLTIPKRSAHATRADMPKSSSARIGMGVRMTEVDDVA